jgi:hypothetical protein
MRVGVRVMVRVRVMIMVRVYLGRVHLGEA